MRTRHYSRKRIYIRKLRRLLKCILAVLILAGFLQLTAILFPALHPVNQQTSDKPTDVVTEKNGSPAKPISAVSQTVPQDIGIISRERIYPGAAPLYVPLKSGAALKNMTRLSFDQIKLQTAQPPEFKIAADGSPEVLILHTFTTQSYQPQTCDRFDPAYDTHSSDKAQNTVYVGDKIEQELQKTGIGVLHDFTIHNQPDSSAAYTRSAQTVQNYIKKHPTIKVVIDVQRDAIHTSENERTAPAAEIDGKSAAQIMLIAGCDDGSMGYPNYCKNLRLSALIASQAEADHPGLMRPVLFDYRKCNQHLSPGAVTLSVGSDANSLEEAAYAGQLVGRSLAEALIQLKN